MSYFIFIQNRWSSFYLQIKKICRKVCIWLCLDTKTQNKIIIYWLLINPLKTWQCSNIWDHQ